MHSAPVIRAGWVSLCVLTIATVSFSQTSFSATPNPTPQQIIYSGKLFGYFRVASLQSGQTGQGCPPLQEAKESSEKSKRASEAAINFLGPRAKEYENAILVGTGDNFAPQLEARVFNPAPYNPKAYTPANKELYNWYQKDNRWVPIEHPPDGLRDLLRRGEGTIPTDNVGCFLAAARFAAVVPGKQDFYFGPERVRELARFMASIRETKDSNKPPDYKPVQMLGANLVIKTTRIEDAPSSPDKTKPEPSWPEPFSAMNLQSVYPWFSYARVKVTELPDGKFRNALKQKLAETMGQTDQSAFEKLLTEFVGQHDKDATDLKSTTDKFGKYIVYLCSPNANPSVDCRQLSRKEARVSVSGNTLSYDVPLDPEKSDQPHKEARFSTLAAGESYELCLNAEDDKTINKKTCLPFSVHRPFFYSPHPKPEAGIDPEPYVFLEKDNLAIFGVVDPNIGGQVGVLNFSWLNQDDKLKTVVSAEDPVEALQQQLEYFQRRHPSFTGLKILLAQMSPTVARVLAAHFPNFQVVVTEADQEQATSETALTTVWSPGTGARAGTFVAVPSPYFETGQREPLEGTVHFGVIAALKTKAANGKDSWNLSSTVLPTKEIEKSTGSKPSKSFQTLVAEGLGRCVSESFPAQVAGQTRVEQLSRSGQPVELIKWLTLCAMREQLGADVALIQKRDFFYQLPKEASDASDNDQQSLARVDVQQVLDRMLWKGDLLTLLYVPGAALKKALDQSKKFDNEDANALSLADNRLRGLEYLGVRKTDKDYLINEAPLDEKKIYAVATTDYIGAGDTGYPDLAASALDQKSRPTQFPEQLKTISGVVCGELYPNDRFKHCLDEITRDDYLDESIAETKASSQPSLGSKLWKLFPFKMPSKDSPLKKTSAALEQKAQHHPIWTLSLRNFSLGFISLNNNLTDAQISKKFAGVPTSGVNTSTKTHTVTLGLDTRLSRSSHRSEFFVAMGIDYKEQSTGDTTPKILQINNRLAGDAGFIGNLWGGRSKDRVGITFTLHAETPLQQPFTTFTLGTKDSLKITQNRSILLLPRVGLRWQNGANFFEAGGQVGREIHALSGYRFNTQGSIVECLPTATETFAACITKLSTPPMTAITEDSVATAILMDRPRAGLYWKYGLSIPFGSKVKYEINQEENQEADFFFNFHQDNATDTKFLDRSKHSLQFTIWPSFSIGPTLRLLLYQNKVNRDFLFQKQFGFEAKFSFDLSNRREKGVQIKHKP